MAVIWPHFGGVEAAFAYQIAPPTRRWMVYFEIVRCVNEFLNKTVRGLFKK